MTLACNITLLLISKSSIEFELLKSAVDQSDSERLSKTPHDCQARFRGPEMKKRNKKKLVPWSVITARVGRIVSTLRSAGTPITRLPFGFLLRLSFDCLFFRPFPRRVFPASVVQRPPRARLQNDTGKKGKTKTAERSLV